MPWPAELIVESAQSERSVGDFDQALASAAISTRHRPSQRWRSLDTYIDRERAPRRVVTNHPVAHPLAICPHRPAGCQVRPHQLQRNLTLAAIRQIAPDPRVAARKPEFDLRLGLFLVENQRYRRGIS